MADHRHQVDPGRAGLSVQQVGRRDVGKGLRGCHVALVETADVPAVEVERPQTAIVVAQREGEHGHQPLDQGAFRESRKPLVVAQVRDRDRRVGVVGSKTGPLAELCLQMLISHC